MKLGLSLVATAIALMSAATSAPAAGMQNDNSCVKTEQHDDLDHSRINLDFTNDCSGSRVCNVTWSVTCDGKAKAHKEAVSLTSKEVKTLTLSAADCDGEWAIRPPSWTCRAAK